MEVAKGSMIQIKRVYDPVEASDGFRYLVDRLWPRGVKKENLPLQGWAKDLAPSDTLRRLYHSERIGWEEFRQRYLFELDADAKAWSPIVDLALLKTVTLLTATRDTSQNHALVLRDFLLQRVSELTAPELKRSRHPIVT